MYNLFQPISILVIASLMYMFIRFTNGGNSVLTASAPVTTTTRSIIKFEFFNLKNKSIININENCYIWSNGFR